MSACLTSATLSLLLLAPAPRPDTAPTGLSLPGGVAEPGGKVGYVNNPRDGIDALDLATGKLLWSSPTRAPLLALAGNRLAVQVADAKKANVVRIAVLDTAARGKRLLLSDPVTFPDWVSVGLAYGRSFTSSGVIRGGELFLKWEARAFYDGGAPPPPDIEAMSRKEAHGVARVNLETGRVKMLSAGEGRAACAVKLPDALKKEAAKLYWNGHDRVTTPLIVGRTLVRPDFESVGDEQVVTVRRWDLGSGRALAPRELLRAKRMFVYVTLDGRHLLIQPLAEKGDHLPDAAWSVYFLATGDLLGRVPASLGAADMAVVGGYAFCTVSKPTKILPRGLLEQPTYLRAISLKTGRVAWERPIEPQRMLPPRP